MPLITVSLVSMALASLPSYVGSLAHVLNNIRYEYLLKNSRVFYVTLLFMLNNCIVGGGLPIPSRYISKFNKHDRLALV